MKIRIITVQCCYKDEMFSCVQKHQALAWFTQKRLDKLWPLLIVEQRSRSKPVYRMAERWVTREGKKCQEAAVMVQEGDGHQLCDLGQVS